MFGDNLKAIRKAKGFTQEELAIKINVVRQTVSKWEKGLSVPDADTLSKIADVLEVNVSELLGARVEPEADRNEVAEQLAKISEQLAIKNRRSKRVWRTIAIVLICAILAVVLLVVINFNLFMFNTDSNHEVITTEYTSADGAASYPLQRISQSVQA